MRPSLWMFGVVAVTVVAMPAVAAITMIENFTAYPVGETIHDRGDWANYEEPHWQAQQNGAALADHTHSNVVQMGNKVALELINRDRTGEVDVVYTAMNLGTNHYITDTGTIYLRFMAMQEGDTLVATNNFWAGWDYGGFQTGDALAPNFQGAANPPGAGFVNNSMLVELNAEIFRAMNGGGYQYVAPARLPGAAYELWMQFDITAQAARFYQCEDQGTPTLVLNATGGQWWAFRGTAGYQGSVENLKFFADPYPPAPATPVETQTYIESIAVNNSAWVTDRPTENDGTPWNLSACNPGDADGDGDVDLDDFVILKNNFGTAAGATCAEGDFDGDGDVDLDDFVLLKNNFGATY